MSKHERTFRENFHMTPSNFEDIYNRVKDELAFKKDTRSNDRIDPRQKLAMTLEYLASGSLQRHIASNYRVSKSSFGNIIAEVCDALCNSLKDQFENCSNSKWVDISNDYNARWNLPNCIGAIDGKHIAIKCPANAASLFYNYKGFHSILLMAVCDAQYRFTFVDVGAYGSEGDAGVFSNCSMGKKIIKNKLKLPDDATIGSVKVPYYFIADDAFPLMERIMKPYVPTKQTALTEEETIFNYRLSRARRCIENSFGILCSKWICLSRTMFCNPDKAQKIVSACIVLHNYLKNNSGETYCPKTYADYYNDQGILVEGEWRKRPITILQPINKSVVVSTDSKAKIMRDHLKNYVNSPQGAAEWQRKAIFLK